MFLFPRPSPLPHQTNDVAIILGHLFFILVLKKFKFSLSVLLITNIISFVLSIPDSTSSKIRNISNQSQIVTKCKV